MFADRSCHVRTAKVRMIYIDIKVVFIWGEGRVIYTLYLAAVSYNDAVKLWAMNH